MARSKHRKKADPVAQDKLVISRAIRKMENSLEWNLKVTPDRDKCMTISEPRNRSHQIFVPLQDPTGGLGYLHELCHAHLSEKIHPLFGAQLFAKGTEKQQVMDVRAAIDFASDWFVEEIEHTLATAPFSKEIAWYLDRFHQMRYQAMPMSEILCNQALVLAQAQRYLNRSAPTDETLSAMSQAFLTTDPTAPSVESVTRLANQLLQSLRETLGQDRQIEWVQDGDVQAWRVTP